MERSEMIFRQAARVVIVDKMGRALLLRGFDPARPDEHYWFTVGGGIDPGETSVDAAIRELLEEIGLSVEPVRLGQPIFRGEVFFTFDGQNYHQEQVFYALSIGVLGDEMEIISTGREDIEQRTIDAHRWWSIEEIENTAEVIYPAE